MGIGRPSDSTQGHRHHLRRPVHQTHLPAEQADRSPDTEGTDPGTLHLHPRGDRPEGRHHTLEAASFQGLVPLQYPDAGTPGLGFSPQLPPDHSGPSGGQCGGRDLSGEQHQGRLTRPDALDGQRPIGTPDHQGPRTRGHGPAGTPSGPGSKRSTRRPAGGSPRPDATILA